VLSIHSSLPQPGQSLVLFKINLITEKGFTTSYEAQVKKMLELLGLAVTRIAVKQHTPRILKSTPDPETSTDVQYPVIFIKGFMSRERAKNDYIYTLLAQFASQIVENRLAHVVFVSSNPGAVKVLSKGNT